MIKKTYSLVLILAFLVSLLPGQTAAQKDKKKLEYEVSVRAQLVPVFAVDKDGNPVYDLKMNEIELQADGKPTDIIYFNTYRIEDQPGKQPPAQTLQAPQTPHKSPERINFIIMDTLVSNKNIMGLSRAIAMGIIDKATPGDGFIILESNQVTGLQYIVGPEKNKKKLADALMKIEKRFLRRRMTVSASLIKEKQRAAGPAKAMLEAVYGAKLNQAFKERERYQSDIRVLAQSVQQLKYALKTITLPKTVFLITSGPMQYAMGRMPVTYYRFLEDAAKAVNLGGSMFYLVNPLMYRSENKRKELKFVTDAVAGKYIQGKNIREIVDNVKKSTSAYYELAFYPSQKNGLKNRIQLKCKRKGVELTTIRFSEKGKPYLKMNPMEKKLFALNIVNRGSWSRMTAKVGRIKYKKLEKENGPVPIKTIQLNIPPFMRNRQSDVLLVHVDPQTQKATVQLEKKSLGEKENVRVPLLPDRDAYFVIIDPRMPVCIYNKVI